MPDLRTNQNPSKKEDLFKRNAKLKFVSLENYDGGFMYKCVKCKRIVTKIEGPVRCPYCGARILSKMRPEVVKTVHAR